MRESGGEQQERDAGPVEDLEVGEEAAEEVRGGALPAPPAPPIPIPYPNNPPTKG